MTGVDLPVPDDLGAAGRALLSDLGDFYARQDPPLIPEEHEVVILVEAARMVDRLELLRGALLDVDLRAPSSIRLLAEERQQRAALSLLLCSRLGLPTGLAGQAPVPGSTPRSRQHQAASRARWAAGHHGA